MTDSGPAAFPSTLWSEVFALQKEDPEGRRERLERLIQRYWRPVYWALRSDGRVPDDEARDLTQEFFVLILEGQIIPGVDPRLGSFRRYLKGALRNFLQKEWRKGNSEKRGGGRQKLSLDFGSPGLEPSTLGTDPEAALDRAWGLQILDEALKDLEDQLEGEGRGREIQIFRLYDMAGAGAPATYQDLAKRFEMTESDILVSLRFCRRRLREIVLGKISPYVRNQSELLEELRELFGG